MADLRLVLLADNGKDSETAGDLEDVRCMLLLVLLASPSPSSLRDQRLDFERLREKFCSFGVRLGYRWSSQIP